MMQIPLTERPRERLALEGGEGLSSGELLAIVLGSGTRDQSVLDLSRELLQRFGGLKKIVDASIPELMTVKGIGKAKAVQLKAVFTLAKHLLRESKLEKTKIQTSKEAYSCLADLFEGEKREKLAVLLLDTKSKVIHREVIGVGTLTQVLVHPRELFQVAVRSLAHSIIVAHNHPSGDPTPSSSDIRLTKHLIHCADIIGIRLSDHLIIGKGSFISLKEKGVI